MDSSRRSEPQHFKGITSVLPVNRGQSQGDIEKKTGLLRCHICRVEKGHTVPAIETLEKMARALEVPCTNFSMTVRSPPNCRIFPSASPPRLTAAGARDNGGRSTDVRCVLCHSGH